MPLEIETVPTGTAVFDWTVPPEWNIRSAQLTDRAGRVVADLAQSALSVVSYSEQVDRTLSLEELKPHLHSVPAYPDAIPYVTSYYKRTWGFCLPDRELRSLHDGEYHAYIDSDFSDNGGVQFGHSVLPGDSSNEILLTSYLCHPSLANNELSGPLVLLGLPLSAQSRDHRSALLPLSLRRSSARKDGVRHRADLRGWSFKESQLQNESKGRQPH
jgi:aminopeptidase-like protein